MRQGKSKKPCKKPCLNRQCEKLKTKYRVANQVKQTTINNAIAPCIRKRIAGNTKTTIYWYIGEMGGIRWE